MTGFDVTKLPANMRGKIMVIVDQKLIGGTACWEWTGAQTRTGYGSVSTGGAKSALAHRASYIAVVGKIARGYTLDHTCRNKLCVNTDHLEVVTRSENSRRRHAAQTHCKLGHELSGDNLRVVERPGGYTRRVCITCQRARNREWMRANRKAEALDVPVSSLYPAGVAA